MPIQEDDWQSSLINRMRGKLLPKCDEITRRVSVTSSVRRELATGMFAPIEEGVPWLALLDEKKSYVAIVATTHIGKMVLSVLLTQKYSSA